MRRPRRVLVVTFAIAGALASCAMTPAESQQPSGSEFSSPLYGYHVTLPADWRPQPASTGWDGRNSDLTNDSPGADVFFARSGVTIWAAATDTDESLDAWLSAQLKEGAKSHPCASPTTDASATLGGEAAVLSTTNCPAGSGTVVAWVAAVHDGRAYIFYYMHPEGLAAEINDADEFHSVFDQVVLP